MVPFRLASYLKALQLRLKASNRGSRRKQLSAQLPAHSAHVEVLEVRQVLAAPDSLQAAANLITSSTATLDGSVDTDGGVEITERGFVYALTAENGTPQIGGANVIQIADAGTGTGAFSIPVTGLNPLSEYSLVSYATNSDGTSYSPVATFATVETPSLIVTTVDDVVDPIDGFTSLREALEFANNTAGADEITFGGAVFSDAVPDTIVLSGTQLVITDSTTITGPGAALLSIDGNNSSRVFYIYNDEALLDVTLSGMTIEGGNANIGGGIINFDENLTLVDSVITGNHANGDGGGLWADGFNMSLTIRRTTISGNSSGDDGGGIYIEDTGGLLLIEDSTISGNTSADKGGGVYLYDPDDDVTIRGTTISGNTAGSKGGGIYLYDCDAGVFTIENSTISGNHAQVGGGVFFYEQDQPSIIRNTTITNNTATSAGGGFFLSQQFYDIQITNTIIAGNTVNGVSNDLEVNETARAITSITNSLIQTNVNATITTESGNIYGQDALLLPLANNGGPTQTHAFAANSLAVNAGIVIPELTTDQRGALRDAVPDIGAYEAAPSILSGPSAITYTENDLATAINPGLAIDGVQVVGATITITSLVVGEDVLGFTNDGLTMGNIAIVSNVGGVLTLTSAGGTATVAEWEAALRAVTYANISEDPTTTQRSAEFQVSSSADTSNVLISTIDITAENDTPEAQVGSATTAEDTPLVFAVIDFPFTDEEGDSLSSITISNLNLAAGDTLTVDLGLGPVPVVDGTTITAAELLTLTYTPAADANGLGRSTFDFKVNDAGLGTVAATMTIDVTAVNDNPVFSSADNFSPAENTTAVGTVSATDVDLPPQTITYSITGGDDFGFFSLNANSGGLTFTAAPDFETPLDADADNVYLVEVTAVDGAGGSVVQLVSVTVTSVNDIAPAFTSSATFTVAENTATVGTVTATDDDDPAQTVTFSIAGGADAGMFAVNPTTGALTFQAAPDFEIPLDADADNIYEVTVRANDNSGLTTNQSIAVTVTPLNDNAPVFTSPAAFNVSENATTVGTVTAADDDEPAQVVTFSIKGGGDATLFTIDPTTGALTFNAAPDFETPLDADGDNVYEVTVRADDNAGSISEQAVTVTVTSLNDNAPVFTSPAAFSVAENSTAVGTVTATDDDDPAQTVTFSIKGGGDAGFFTINSTTGALAFVAGPDFETPLDADADNVYEVTVRADDNAGSISEQLVMVTVTPVNDNVPTITSPSEFVVPENTAAVGTVTATDDDDPPQTITFTISGGADAVQFNIDAATGALTFAVLPDFENPQDANADNVYEVTVVANDNAGSTISQNVTVTVTALNDNTPVFTSPVAFNVAENTSAVGTVTATDGDVPEQNVTYTITGGADQLLFTINSTTGALTFIAAPDFETPQDADTDNAYDVIVTANDNAGLTMTQNITVTVTPLNDNVPVFTSLAVFNVVENETAVGTVVATDADLPAQNVTYSITGGVDAGLFSINPATGALVFLAGPDFENPSDVGGDNVYNVQVTANDNSGSLIAQDIAVTVTNAVETPVITLNPVTGRYHVGKDRAFVDPTATFEADITASDYSGARLTVSIISNRDKKDILSIYKKETDAGGIDVKGKKLLYGGIEIGTISGGKRKQPDLVIEFNAAATEEALNQLVKRVNFETKNNKLPQPTRTLQMQVTNVSGQDSNAATRLIDIVAANA